MKLAAYLEQAKITEKVFADRIKVWQGSVNRYKAGRIPEPEIMARIVEATGGKVQPSDFYDIPAPQPADAIEQDRAA